MKRASTYIEKHSIRVLVFIIVLFVLYFSFVGFSRHNNFYSRRLDLGNMDQTVWNVLHGNGFTLTDPMGSTQESRLAVHADFLLILFAPLYLIWSDPRMLIFLQILVAGIGALPVYWIAKDVLQSKKLALLFALIFLLYPPTQRNMLHDFHAVALSTTFLLFAYWFMQREKYVYFAFFAILASLGKEQIWLTTGFMGLYIMFVKKKYVFGVLAASISFLVFYFLFWHAIPAVTTAKQHFALVYLSEFGENQNVILKNIFLNPLGVLGTMTRPDRLYYYFQLFFPVGFFSLLSPLTLLFAAPSLAINALSNINLMRQIDYQYNSAITPFVFISAIQGYLILKKIVKIRSFMIAGWIIVCMVISVFLWGELPGGATARLKFFTTPLPEKQIMQQTAQSVDSKYSVSATNNIGAHFSQRQFLYNFPVNATTSDYSIIYLGDPYAWPSGDAQKDMVKFLLESPSYLLISHQGNFYAFKRKGI